MNFRTVGRAGTDNYVKINVHFETAPELPDGVKSNANKEMCLESVKLVALDSYNTFPRENDILYDDV